MCPIFNQFLKIYREKLVCPPKAKKYANKLLRANLFFDIPRESNQAKAGYAKKKSVEGMVIARTIVSEKKCVFLCEIMLQWG